MAYDYAGVDHTQVGGSMSDRFSLAIILRFRDLVTEVGETIAEHRRIVRQDGHVWWGWWYRQSEHVPRQVLRELSSANTARGLQVILFHSGTFEAYSTRADRIVVAPSVVGVNSPEYHATPEYYLRGRYPAWFRFCCDISRIEIETLEVVERPTLGADHDAVPADVNLSQTMSLRSLRDERPTLWLCREIEGR